MIKLYAANLNSLIQDDITAYLRFISESRRAKIARYRKPDDARRSVIAELLVRKVVMQLYGKKNQDIVFSTHPLGKPFVKALPEFHFNLAHSGQWVVCAVSEKEVGVDIQRIQEIDPAVLRYCLTQAYKQFFPPDREQSQKSFYQGWTKLESFLKAMGMGFMRQQGENGVKMIAEGEQVFFFSPEIDPDYCLTVCGFENELDPQIKLLDFSPQDFQE